MTVVSLQISLTDSNDNPPVFLTQVYKASIDEDAVKFEPELQVIPSSSSSSSIAFNSPLLDKALSLEMRFFIKSI